MPTVDNRLIIPVRPLLSAVSMWQVTQFSLYMGMEPVIVSGLVQGFGLRCTFVPLNTIALSNLPRHIMTQGTALRSLMRNLGGSVGISILEAGLTENIQTVHSRLVQQLRPDNPLAQAPHLAAPFSLTDPAGIAALNAEVDPASVDGRLHQRFRADDDYGDRLLRAVVAGASAAPNGTKACHRHRLTAADPAD